MLQSVVLYHHTKNQKIHSSISKKMSKTQFFYTQSPPNPWIIIFWKLTPRTDVAQCWPLSPCKKWKQFIVGFPRECQKTLFFTPNLLLTPGLFFFKLTSRQDVALRWLLSSWKNHNFWHLIPINPRSRYFLKIPTVSLFFIALTPNFMQNFTNI